MTVAHRCDHCGEYSEGMPAVTLTADLETPSGPGLGVFERMFDVAGSAVELDFCSVGCLLEYPLEDVRDELLSDVDDKELVLEASGENGGADDASDEKQESEQ